MRSIASDVAAYDDYLDRASVEPSLSEQLDAAEVAVAAITFETKPRDDGGLYYRWTCATCGRIGTWLHAPETVRRNSEIHAMAHAQGDIP